MCGCICSVTEKPAKKLLFLLHPWTLSNVLDSVMSSVIAKIARILNLIYLKLILIFSIPKPPNDHFQKLVLTGLFGRKSHHGHCRCHFCKSYVRNGDHAKQRTVVPLPSSLEEKQIFIYLIIQLQKLSFAQCRREKLTLYVSYVGRNKTQKPLQLVVGTLSPTSVFLSWGILVNPQHDWTATSNCASDR